MTFFCKGPFSLWLLYPDREKAVTGNEGDDGLLACAHLLLYWFSINLLPALSKPLTLPQGRVLLGRVPGCSACPPPPPQCPGAQYKAQHGLNAHGATSGTWPRPAKSSNHFTHPPPPPVLSNALKTGLNCDHSLKYILDAQNGQLSLRVHEKNFSFNQLVIDGTKNPLGTKPSSSVNIISLSFWVVLSSDLQFASCINLHVR